MKTSRLAVIDLGSNTFHLLIIEAHPDRPWMVLAKDRHYVKLASGGLDNISEEGIQRAIPVMKDFARKIRDLHVDETYAIGTAALREAKNGKEVARILQEQSGIPIDIIDGQQEAAYILKGIQAALPDLDKPALIVDIGGGSVEFILYHQDQLLFARSFKIGVALLYRLYHQHDPMAQEEIISLENRLETELQSVLSRLGEIDHYFLIGASGSFEVIQDVLPKIQSHDHWSELQFDQLEDYLSEIIVADLTTRRLRKEIPDERVDYIVVAYILIRFILRSRPPERLFYCDYALKEGVIAEHL